MAEKHQHDRSEARRLALQVLYQAEILETDPATIIEEGRLVDETQLLGNYARRLIEGATADQEADRCRTGRSERELGAGPHAGGRSTVLLRAWQLTRCVQWMKCPSPFHQ